MPIDKSAIQVDMALLLGRVYPCPLCQGQSYIRLTSTAKPILTLEDRALAVMAGRQLRYAWMPEGMPLAMCERGHLDTAPGTDLASVRRAVEEARCLSAKSHLTGAQRRRLRRMQAKTNRFYDSQRRHFEHMVGLWERLGESKVDFTTLDVRLPLTAEDLRVLEKGS
jgi:hypothetical protein